MRYRLRDAVNGTDLGSESAPAVAGDLRLAAHKIADTIYQKLTGERGVFATRLVYVNKAGPRYSLRVADADGEGEQTALKQPRGDHLAGLVAGRQRGRLRQLRVAQGGGLDPGPATGKRRKVADFRGTMTARPIRRTAS